jgi:hypothetical protein
MRCGVIGTLSKPPDSTAFRPPVSTSLQVIENRAVLMHGNVVVQARCRNRSADCPRAGRGARNRGRWRRVWSIARGNLNPGIVFRQYEKSRSCPSPIQFPGKNAPAIIAQRLGVSLVGCGAVLLALKSHGLIAGVQPALAAWQAHGYYVSPKLQAELLERRFPG